MDNFCERLSAWTAATGWEGMSRDAQRMMRRVLLDTLGCAIAGRVHPAVAQAQEVADALPGAAVATGLGSGTRRSVLGAILDSGAAIRALDLNDFYWGPGLGGHPSDIFAAAFAVAEETNAAVNDMLAAIAAGYEVYTRQGDLLRGESDIAPPWDHTGFCALSTAVICGCLYRLPQAALTEALAIVAARAPVFSALRAGRISSVKAAAPALAQIDAYLGVLLARAGMTGPVGSIGGARGLQALIDPTMDLAHIIPDDTRLDRALAITIKRFPSMGTSQAAIAAMIALHQRLGPRLDEIAAIRMHLTDTGIVRRQTADLYRRPDRRETADHSFYALSAMALLDGRLEEAQFAHGRWRQPDAIAMIARLTLAPDLPASEGGVFAARAVTTMTNGETIDVDMPYAPGHPKNPLSDEGVGEKFLSVATPVIGDAAAVKIAAVCLSDDNLKVRDLTALLLRAA